MMMVYLTRTKGTCPQIVRYMSTSSTYTLPSKYNYIIGALLQFQKMLQYECMDP